jgi:putative hydrolase of the HAD superfamily
MPRPKAILFDLDDTLISSSGDRQEVWSEALAPHLHRFAERTEAELTREIEAELRWFWSDPVRHRAGRLNIAQTRLDVIGTVLARLGIADATLAADLSEAFRVSRDKRTRLFDDAHTVLDRLKADGFQLCLITNGEGAVQREKVRRFDLGHRFHHIQIEGEHPFGKPEPEAYDHALKQLGALHGEAWIVGDNLEWEVAVPSSLGFDRCIWFDGFGRGLPKKAAVTPTHSLTRLRDLLPMLDPA